MRLVPRPPVDPHDAEALLGRILELSVPLHPAIAAFDEPGAVYRLAGPPGIAFFERDARDTISHVSGAPSPTLVLAIDELRERHLRAAGVAAGHDNSHLPALLLLCSYVADENSRERAGIDRVVRRPALAAALDEEAGRHDPQLEPFDAALRAWTPIAADHAPEAGVHPAILELRFPARRHQRYVPWEGAAGEARGGVGTRSVGNEL